MGGAGAAAPDAEARPMAAPESGGLPGDDLLEHAGERRSPPACLALQHGEIVGLCGQGRSSDGHASDAVITDVRGGAIPA